ncbi:LOW QUALITY PROTEIN: sushi, von Willebrand factor type A, EGF and pentraxin domain-containing protein 1-like [Diadema antillarum]|uniref:LOW QUALITY PROTEIN: sushi, von Willebrand factor type A, EGF and pentraxin domain-containing protein 1-like n=1 Tax=Diadema antillarum TaxID=105358 RepID=UPI003A871C92
MTWNMLWILVVVWMSLHMCACRNLHFSTLETPRDGEAGFNTSLSEQQLEFADDPQPDGSISPTLFASASRRLPDRQALSHRSLHIERSHQEIYESLWKNANVPMDTSSASKIDVLGYLLKKQVKKLRDVSNGQVELVFLVDSSASVGIENFFNELKFVKKLLADFTVAPDATRVAIITFSSKHRVDLNVNQLDDSNPQKRHHKCALLNEDLPKITYVGGGTYTKGAFENAKKVLEAARPNSTKSVFLLTDGLSNGPNPVPVAELLKDDGVEVFTFGIRDGYIPELLQMASARKDEHCYILDSFAEFEALARRALHEDLRVGEFIEESPEKCASRCLGGAYCCDPAATCRCGTHTGSYDCVCPAGFYGSGLRGSCRPCPVGSYKHQALPGGISTCLPCPDPNQVSPTNSTSSFMCICKEGYRWDIATSRCQVIQCPVLTRPENGEFVECSNVFHGACAVRCHRGYELTGSSIRLCFANGSWSGEEFRCRVKKCEEFVAPMNGSMQCTSDNFAFGTVCTSGCDSGFKLVGSPSRRCLPIAQWDGLPVTCRPIQCPMLSAIPFGSLFPSRCSRTRQDYGSVCRIRCNPGFQRRGPRKKECLANGSWSNQYDPSAVCEDFTVPNLVCPSPITVETAPRRDSTLVTWTVPTPTDNSGEVPTLRAIPNVESPWEFPLGHWNVTYIAEDASQNRAQCVFSVIVEDREPPSISRCRSPSTVITSRQEHRVMWDEPLFSDNSGSALTVTRSHAPGSLFPLGRTSVEYLATDEAGNTRSCVIFIDVQQNLCQKPRDPVGGSAVCLHTTQGMNCTVTCGPGYALSTRPRGQYFCALDGTWHPDGKVPWDDCSETHHANNVLQPMTFLYETSDCDTPFARRVEKILSSSLDEPIRNYCGDGVTCRLSSVEARCDSKDPITLLHGLPPTFHGDLEPGAPQALQGPGDISVNPQRLRLLATPNLFVNVVINASVIPNDTTPDQGLSAQSYDKVVAETSQISNRIETNLNNGSIESGANRSMEGLDGEGGVRVWRIRVIRKEPEAECSPGSVRQGRGRDAQCVPCIHGTYFNESMSSCEYCPRGTFQDRVGQTECQPCPLGTSTLTNKATTLDECRELCQPGSHSPSGLELCELCPINNYQSEWGATECIPCPRRLQTADPGAANPSQCRAPCPSGHTSATGLEPCLPCPAGTFKMSNRFTYCLRCPADFPFSNPGISSIRGCRNAQNAMGNYQMAAIEPVPFSECFSSPCQNGATCISASRGYTCQCPQGFSGLRCEVEVDECETAMCLNNGTCQDLLNGYECLCPDGFTGRHCSEDIDECGSYPCANGGTCINGPNQFECICPEQYTGDRCEADKDECMSAPCHNNGSCRDLMGGFVCICPPGFYGNICEMDYDECSSYPCQNNATCIDLQNDFSCQCKEGFAGERCELNVDDCASNPCVNGATCTDLIADVLCQCLPGFRGHLCEEEMSWDFNLIFDRAGVEDYVILERDFPALSAVTIAFWMRTDDTANYGTVFSYAISDSNANVLTLTDYSGFVLDVNGHLKVTDVTTNDGHWHHVAITWESSGSYQVFKDGELQASGQELARGATLPGGGKFILGQEQDSLGGGFHPRESFVGELYLLTVSDRVLGADEVRALSRSCERLADVVVAWPDFLPGVQGDIQRVENHFCEGCPPPARPDNGLVHDYQAATPLSSVRYDCQPGFQLPRYEISSAECQISGEWSPSAQPYCERISCGHPGPVNHGRVVGRSYLFGDQVLHACHRNFTLLGPLFRECQANGQWSEQAPECRYVICLAPPAMPNSEAYTMDTTRSVEMAFPGHVAEYQCNRGFRLTGPANVTCQTNGQWSEPPSCRIISCPPLVPSPNPMLVTSNGSVYSSIAEYRCSVGYRMQGRAVIQCQETGLWDYPVPTCSVVVCGNPRSIPNADVTFDGISYRSTAWYTCREGYESDRRASYCSARGSWEPPAPVCRPVQCPAIPSVISHTTIRGTDFTFNNTIVFECDRGYVLSGERQIRCTGNGRWSGDPPICNPVPCADPPVFDDYADNATAAVGSFTFGAIVQYDCHSGFYRPTPGSQLVCAEDGRWVGSLSTCLPVSCGPPSHILHASYQGQDHTYDQTVTYRCDTGYEVTGNPSITCQASGQWSPTTALCSLINCGDPPVINNADISPERRFNETVRYTCRHGYVSDDSMELFCDATGTWQGLPPTCSPIFCGPPPSQENGFFLGDTWTFPSSVELSCNGGYELLGDPHIHCLGSGQWSNSSSRCTPLSCQLPVTISHGIIIGLEFTYGSHIEYQCHDGYILEGQSTLHCTENALWSGPPPRCRAVNCGPPADMEDGLYIGYDFTFNQTVLYICQPGFEFGREADYVEAMCLANGTWSQLTAVCRAVNCGEPAPPAHGSVAGSVYTYSSIITYSCNPGYTLIGLSSQTCTSNGTWSGPAPSCEPRDCGGPPMILNGVASYIPTTFESTANYSCLTGYQSSTPLTLQCDAAGMWVGEADNTSCQRIQCEEEMVIHNGFAEDAGPYVYGDIVQISCTEGFKSDTIRQMECTALGTWMPKNISCEPIFCPPVQAPENGIIVSGSQRWGEELMIGCVEGYRLVGNESILCTGDGVWIGGVPECVVITCEALQTPENGVLRVEDHSYGNRAEFECDRGFQMVGSNTTECTGRGTWSNPPPTCTPISCSYPANPSHGVAIFVDTYYGDVVSYVCEPGYRLVGTETRECLADGSWGGASPSCTPVECEVTDAFPQGSVIRNDTVILGDEVIYSCNPGYEVLGQTSRICTQDGTLSGETPACIRVTCGPPPPLLNGHSSYTSNTFESNATYACDQGYILEGSARTSCLANGSWELIYHNCQPVECSLPAVIPNGAATMNFTQPIFGTVTEYTCEYGYELRGQGIHRCQANGEWSDRAPQCEPVSCGKPPALLNGFHNFSTTTFGSRSTYSCYMGYVLVGNRVRVCQATALWSEVVQSCEPISCGMPVTPPHSTVMTFNTSLNGIARYRCDMGYRLVGAHTRRCTQGGEWSGAVPECVPVTCPTPTSIENGDIITFGRMQFLDHIHYRCHPGHKIQGDVRRVCQADETWSGRRPSCRPISCEVPPIIKNGVRTYRSLTFNSTTIFECHSGYVLRGTPVLKCMADGTWYPHAPACQAIRCGPLPHPQNGRVVVESKVYRSTAIYSCNEGFVINGSKRRGCLASGVWSESSPSCQAKLCQPLPVIEYALYPANKTKFVVGDFVELECKAGYQATSDGVVHCLGNQTWSTNDFSCVPSSCSEPLLLENGRAKYTSVSFGSTVTYLCNEGFRAVGETVATCQANLNWSSPPPQCLPATCPELVAPENVILSSTSISVGTTVLMSCSGHSYLVGASQVVCLANGTWSHPLPRCIPSGCGPPPSPDNGVSHGDSFLPGDVVSFRCHRGFYREGSSLTTCLPDNTWSHPTPVCIRFNSVAAVQNRPICVVPCLHGGKCVGPYSCECPYGFAGPRCGTVLCASRCIGAARCAARDARCRR